MLRQWDNHPSISPVYLGAGNYLVMGEVRDAAGSIASAVTNLTVSAISLSTEDVTNLIDQQVASANPDAILTAARAISSSAPAGCRSAKKKGRGKEDTSGHVYGRHM